MHLSFYRRQKTTAGFSLIEMIVAVSVFLIAILIISGALLRLVDASQKAHSVRGVMDNVGTALEGMSRTMRFGTVYHCGCEVSAAAYATQQSCPLTDLTTGAGGADCIAFEGPDGDPSNDNDQTVYRFQSVSGKGQIQRSLDSGTTWSVVTSPETIITALKFYVNGTDADNDQPSANIIVRGYVQESPETKTTFDVQTIVTQRAPNFADGSFYQGGAPLPPPPPACVPEDTQALCSDGIDNDCNGLTDCKDYSSGCQGFDGAGQVCQEICNDGIDNNGNGQTDCADLTPCGDYGFWYNLPNAVGNPHTNFSKPVPAYGCQEVRGPNPNDPAGMFPFNQAGPKDPGNGCSDGIDNNNTSGIDCKDSYYCRNYVSGKCKEICNNGVDDNGNGLIDCQEWAACGSDPFCTGPGPGPSPTPPPGPGPAPKPVCGDGICSGGETAKSCKGDCKGHGNEG